MVSDDVDAASRADGVRGHGSSSPRPSPTGGRTQRESVGAKRAISAFQFASSDAGSDEEATACRSARRSFRREQQREDLDGLAEPHVVGQAGAEPEAREEARASRARLLVGPQRAAQRRGRPRGREALGVAQPGEHLRRASPPRWTNDHSRSSSTRVAGRPEVGRRPGQEPHPLDERDPALPAARFDLLPVRRAPPASRSRSTSTHWPRSRTSPSSAASSCRHSSSVSVSSPRASSTLKSSMRVRRRSARLPCVADRHGDARAAGASATSPAAGRGARSPRGAGRP